MKSTIRGALVLATLLQPGSELAAALPTEYSILTDIWSGTSFNVSAAAPFDVAPQLETVVLEVSGMWSTCCERYLERALLEPLEGVDRAQADHKSDTVTVWFDPEKLTADEIAAGIEACPFFDVTGSPSHSLKR